MVSSTLGFVLCLLIVSVVCEAAFQSCHQTHSLGRNQQQQESSQQTQLNAFPNGFRVKSKKRGKVVLDPATGFYRPEKPSDVKEQATIANANANADRPRRWDGFKSAVYGTVDGIRTLPKKIRIITSRGQNAVKDMGVKEQDTNAPGDTEVQDLIVGGYADKAKVLTTTATPIERIESDLYQKMNVNLYVGAKQQPQKQQPLPVPPKEEPPTVSVFDSVKGAFYATVDTVEGASSNSNSNNNNNDSKKKKETPVMKTFKPLVQTPRSLTMSQDVRQALIDRGSENPVKKAAAELTVLQWELDYYENVQEPNEAEKENAVNLKESIYKLGDTLEESINEFEGILNTLMAFPDALSNFVEKWVQFFASIPDKSQQAFDTVSAIPARLEETKAEAEKSLQNAIDQTNQLVADVKAIPDNVQKSVQQTQKSIDDTVDSVNELTTKTKVLLRLEKPVPKPPSIPPPALTLKQMTASQIGMKVSKFLVTGTAKTVWWVGRNAGNFVFSEVKEAISSRGAPESATVERSLNMTNGDAAFVASARASATLEPPTVPTKPNGAEEEKPSVEASATTDKKKPVLEQPERSMGKGETPTAKAPDTAVVPEARDTAVVPEAPAAAVAAPELSDLDREVQDALRIAEEALQYASDRDSLPKNDLYSPPKQD